MIRFYQNAMQRGNLIRCQYFVNSVGRFNFADEVSRFFFLLILQLYYFNSLFEYHFDVFISEEHFNFQRDNIFNDDILHKLLLQFLNDYLNLLIEIFLFIINIV